MKRTSDNDRVRLQHMRDYALIAVGLVRGRERDVLNFDVALAFGLERLIEIVCEAASNVTAETRSAHPEIQWEDIVGMRVILAHKYFAVERDIIWKVVTVNFPELIDQLDRILGDME